MAVPYTFGTATSSIPLSQLDSNFSTAITLGNTAIQLGNTATTLNNMTLANVTIASGNVTLTNVTVTTANVTTANITTAVIVNDNVTNLVATSANVTTANVTTANIGTDNITNATVSGSLTLSGGTANGVAYLNGSKVVTTGSALTFDGTNLSVGGTASNQRLNVIVPVFTTSASGGMRIGDSGSNYYTDYLVKTDGSANPYVQWSFASHTLAQYWYGGGNNYWAWYANNAEQMRLTSTGLGIGTSSPSYKLDTNITVTGAKMFRFGNSSIPKYLYGYVDSGGTGITNSDPYTSGVMYYQTGSVHNWYTGSTQSMTLDASGNLLVGTTSTANTLGGLIVRQNGNGAEIGGTGSTGSVRVRGTASTGAALIDFLQVLTQIVRLITWAEFFTISTATICRLVRLEQNVPV